MNLKAVLLRQTFCQSSYTEAFSWHKVHIWTFKSKYVNRCLLSKSIIKLDFTWVRKILFPSLCICHLEIIFHFRRQPYGLWLERESEKVEYPTRVRWARAFQMKAMPPSSENVESNETDHYFSHGFQAFLPQVSDTHWIHTLSFMVLHEFGIWASAFSKNLVEYLIYLADFSSGHRWNKTNDILMEGFSQIHMFYLVAITHNFCHSDQLSIDE